MTVHALRDLVREVLAGAVATGYVDLSPEAVETLAMAVATRALRRAALPAPSRPQLRVAVPDLTPPGIAALGSLTDLHAQDDVPTRRETRPKLSKP